MSNTYTVRLEDGSEIGPLDLPAVREWYARGLIHAESPVLPPGARRWLPLRQVRGLHDSGPAPRPAAPRRSEPAPSRPSARPARSRGRAALAWAALALGVSTVGGAGVHWLRTGRAAAQPEAPPAIDAAAASARLTAERRAEAVQRAVAGAPHLTPRCAETLMSRSQAEVLSPEETYRRAEIALRRGLPALNAAETRELGRLVDARHARANVKERARLASYLERLRTGRPTSPDDDRAMAQLVRTADLKLAPPSLERLRALYEKAVLGSPR